MANIEKVQWNFEDATPITRVITAHFEQRMKKPVVSHNKLIWSIYQAFDVTPTTDVVALADADLFDILEFARPGQIERGAFELACLAGAHPIMEEAAIRISRADEMGKLERTKIDFAFLAAYALGNLVQSPTPELIQA